ncbi:hypothetical protein ICJ04_07850 [Stenotrophomonas sp. 169]|uniref:hypothetical protein n=1 Tax=unclassified Stenotrophomonas TaxID=196198 RepID=UPI00166280B5|nr:MULTISPECIES: hypothetical protein [unclassified Stenotrophomonas]MBD8696532.1 hypothetical protein [Stenotrophomonas sp. CFBP 13718]QNR98783.1 hypothetical protein ICJ04_07850 [Stenotrophomonas sp. 169]
MKWRIALSVLIWLLCIPGMMWQLMFVTVALGQPLSWEGWPPLQDLYLFVAAPASLAAWPILGALNLRWLERRPLHWRWPLMGTLLAVGWLLPGVLGLLLFAAPGVLFATYLCLWHVTMWRRQQRTA